jgi:hypothetical protein
MTIACHHDERMSVPNRHAATAALATGVAGSKPWTDVIRTQCDFGVRLPATGPKGVGTRRRRG